VTDVIAESAWFSRYEGLNAESFFDLARAERRPVRVISPDTVALTMDFRPTRLNVWFDRDGNVIRM
jgi:Peptidase inhibitor I78 family